MWFELEEGGSRTNEVDERTGGKEGRNKRGDERREVRGGEKDAETQPGKNPGQNLRPHARCRCPPVTANGGANERQSPRKMLTHRENTQVRIRI